MASGVHPGEVVCREDVIDCAVEVTQRSGPAKPQCSRRTLRRRYDAQDVDIVAAVHDEGDTGVADVTLEQGEVVLAEVLQGDDGVEGDVDVALPVLKVVHGKVLAVGGDLKVRRCFGGWRRARGRALG